MAKECRSKLKPCTIALCTYSFMHNEDSHKAMLEKGIDVSPDRLPPAPQSANNTNNSQTEDNVPQGKLLALAKKYKEQKARQIQKCKERRKKAMALLTQSEAEQSSQVDPDQLAIDYSGENNVNITPKTEVKEVKVSKLGIVPKAGWQQLMSYLDNTGNTWGVK